MTDHELLELAAKAAGIEIYESTDGTVQNRSVWVFSAGGAMGTMPYEERWDPINRDDQALRLAVKLSISVDPNATIVAAACNIGGDYFEEQASDFNGDLCAATRRAIVRAAAEIGKGM